MNNEDRTLSYIRGGGIFDEKAVETNDFGIFQSEWPTSVEGKTCIRKRISTFSRSEHL